MKTKYNETKRVQTRILRYTLKMLAIQVYVYNINNVGDDLLWVWTGLKFKTKSLLVKNNKPYQP